jgi:hypothetical protein
MPVSPFTLIPRHDFTKQPHPQPVQTPAPPRKKPGPPVKPRAKVKPRHQRRISPQQRTILIDNLEAAIETGRIELCDEELPCTFLDMTAAELRLLGRILFKEGDAEAAFAKLAERAGRKGKREK